MSNEPKHADYQSAIETARTSLTFPLSVIISLLEVVRSKSAVIAIQTALDIIMASNYAIAWPLYIHFAKIAKLFQKSLFLDSLILCFRHIAVSSYIPRRTDPRAVRRRAKITAPMFESPMIRVSMPDGTSATSVSLLSVAQFLPADQMLGRSEELYKFKNYLRGSPELPGDFLEYETLYLLLTSEGFKIFWNPVSLNIRFLQAAISCCMTCHLHDQVFSLMIDLFGKSMMTFKKENLYSAFFIAWFKQLSVDWDFAKLMIFAGQCQIGPFLANFIPPMPFVFYAKLFYENLNQNRQLLASLIIDCFLWPILTFPDDYRQITRIDDAHKIRAFLGRLEVDPLFESFLSGLIEAESYYSHLTPKTFDMDSKIVMWFLSKRPPSVDLIPLSESIIPREKYPSPSDLRAMPRWLCPVGKEAFLIKAHRIPLELPFETLFSYFLMHIGPDDRSIILIVDAKRISAAVVERFAKFVQAAPRDFASGVRRVFLIRLSLASCTVLQKVPGSEWTAKVALVDDLEEALKGERVFLNIRYVNECRLRQGLFTVTMSGTSAFLSISDTGFVLSSPIELTRLSGNQFTRIPFRKIERIEDDGVTVTFVTNSEHIKIGTNNQKFISNIWKSWKAGEAIQTRIDLSEMELLSPSLRVHSVALCLYLLASNSSFVNVPAIQLFEAAIGNRPDVNQSCDIGAISQFELRHLFDEVVEAELIDDVAMCLTSYLTNDDLSTLPLLLPFFVTFMNQATERSAIAMVGWKLFSLANNKLHVLLLSERFFWNKIKSRVAIECLVPMVMASDVNSLILRRTLRAIQAQNVLGDFVVNHCLDGCVRRHSFGGYLPIGKIFNSIVTLPFKSPNFVSTNLPALIFCSIVSAIHSSQEVLDSARLFLDSAIESIYPPPNNLLNARAKVRSLMQNAKLIESISMIDFGHKLSAAISEEVGSKYIEMITDPKPGENMEIWYIKVAASAHFNCCKSSEIGLKFVRALPGIFQSGFHPQKLALVFSTVGTLLPTFPKDSNVPIMFLWCALLSVSHSNHQLRTASTRMLAKLVPYALGIFRTIHKVGQSRFFSNIVADAVETYEGTIHFSFQENFAYAFNVQLTRALEDIETRQRAVELVKECLGLLRADHMAAVWFALSFVAFAHDDPQWVLNTVETKCQSIGDFIFYSFDKRGEDERDAIVSYLARMFGERLCAHRTELLADCLMFGIRKCPRCFRKYKSYVLNICWKKLTTEVRAMAFDRLAMLFATMVALDGKQGRAADPETLRASDDVLGIYIRSSVDGIAALASREAPGSSSVRFS
jgi:hypothetical protein